jgi:hypothetical protein
LLASWGVCPLLWACGGPPPAAAPGSEDSGRLQPEVIQSIVRSHYPELQKCYGVGLGDDPHLKGRVQVRFVINREGKVRSVRDEGSDLPDRPVVDCVVSKFYEMTFPPPEGGIVTVVYPINFEPE